MSRFYSRRAAAASSFLALGAAALSAPVRAEDAQSDVQRRTEGDRTIIVTGERGERLESPRATSDLLDTSQTVTLVSDQTIRRQNLLTLRDALATLPGITFGAGEGGGGYGDSINLRGYTASNDITIDGVRDSAQYSRSDPFNIQQLEIYNGANSVFNGSGSVGGTINIVSKIPQAENLTILSAAVGTDDYYRATLDVNHRLSDTIAVRVNGMFHRNDYPGRDVERWRRWGIAPAVTFGIGGQTRLTLAAYYQHDNNTPLYGVPFFINQLNNGIVAGGARGAYYGYRNLDEQITDVTRLTATLEHEFSEGISIRNLTRYQAVDQYSQTSAPQGTFCLAGTGFQPVSAGPSNPTGASCTFNVANVSTNNTGTLVTVPVTLAPGTWLPSGPRGLVRDQQNRLITNQTDLRIVSGTPGALRNTLVVGGQLTWEDYGIETASLPRNAAGAPILLPVQSIANPSGVYTGPINYTVTARSRSETRNQAIYAFDTLEIGRHFELNAGVRLEHNEATFRNIALAAYPPATTPLTAAQLLPQNSEETLFSYRFGAVYKPTEATALYIAYGNARTPTSATVRLGCGVVAAIGATDPCRAAPETARNYEIGARAEILDRRLLLTAALFRNERSNFRVPANDPAAVNPQVVDGRSRVDGLALGAAGFITPRWQIFANYTYLDGEVLQSVSDSCLADPDPRTAPLTACGNSDAIPDPQAGDRLIQTPRHSGSLFTTYRFPFGLEVGYGLTYQGSFATYQRNLLQRTQYFTDDYLLHRLFLSYTIREGLTAQLNIQNLTNEHYFTAIRNNVNATSGAVTGGWALPGEGRQAVLSLFYSF